MSTEISAPRTGATRNVVEGTILGVVLTTLSYLVGLNLDWINDVNLLEAFAVFTSYVCTYLCVKERRINYPIGAVSTAAYCVLFAHQGLAASAILNAYLTPLLAYGWFRWRNDQITRSVTRVSARMVPLYALVAVAIFAGATAITLAFGAKVILADSAILLGTILAQFLLDNKKWENWLVWAVVNVFAIHTYWGYGLKIAAVQYVFFLANTVYGLIVWNRSRTDEATRPLTVSSSVPALV